MKPSKAVIPCAGLGTRFLPITKLVPKELLPAGNKPTIQYVVEEVTRVGIRDIVLVCNGSKLNVSDYFAPDPFLIDALQRKGRHQEIEQLKAIHDLARIEVVYQEEPSGLGDAIWSARKATGDDPFLVALPDDLIFPADQGTDLILRAVRERAGWGILVEEVSQDRISSYGVISGTSLSHDLYRIERVVEKPPIAEAPSRLAIIGRYLFPPEIYPLIEGTRHRYDGEIYLTHALNELASRSPGLAVLCRGRRFDTGSPEGLLEASLFCAQSTLNRSSVPPRV